MSECMKSNKINNKMRDTLLCDVRNGPKRMNE